MISFKDTVLILRVSRLGRIPPALASTELMQEGGLPVKVVEFGSVKETQKTSSSKIPRIRFDAPLFRFLPKKVQFPLLLLMTFFRLAISFFLLGRPRILVAHGLAEQFLAWILSKIFWVPYVIHAHEIYDKKDLQGEFSHFLFSHEKMAFNSSAFVIFPESRRAQIYRERYQFKSPIFISANAPRLGDLPQARDLRKAYQIKSDSLLMGYMGGIGPTNCLELAIEALVLAPKVVFLIWGWGDSFYINHLKTLAKDLGVSNRVKFLGELSERKYESLAGCDFSYCVYDPHLLRTRYQALASNKLFEAMAVRIPSIFSSQEDFYRFNLRYSVGICTKNFSFKAVANAMNQLVQDKSLRHRLGENARKAFENEFYYERQFHKPLQAFQDLYHGYPEIWSFNELYFPPENLSQAA